MEIKLIDPATINPLLISDDGNGIHRWTEELVKCPITFTDPKKNTHYHFMKCGDCGVHRFGAHAEQGAYHYFTYEHPNKYSTVISGKEEEHQLQDELIPPCTAQLAKKFEVRIAKVCGGCMHVCNREGICDYKCNAPIMEVRAVALKNSHKPHPLSDFIFR